MQPLNPVDQLFFHLERHHQPMHVGALLLFRVPHTAPTDFAAQLVTAWRACQPVGAPFDIRVTHRLGLPMQTHVAHVDLGHHVQHVKLPAPGGMAQLLAAVSRWHGTQLPRSHPLWQCHVIEGVAADQLAVYFKIHHGLMDGVTAMRWCHQLLARSPANRQVPNPWAGLCAPRAPSSTRTRLQQSLHVARREATGLPAIIPALRTNQRARHGDDAYTGLDQAPRCMLNRRIGSRRRVVAQAFPLAQIQQISAHHHGTVNDIVLALCSGALRRYLQDHDALPQKPLIAVVPMAVRSEYSNHGNQLAMICANLATHLADPVARLHAIQRAVGYWKQRYAHMTTRQIRNLSAAMALPTGLHMLAGRTPQPPAFNLVISNVPGPDQPLYLQGAQLQHIYPASVICDGMALNITVTSCDRQLHFGLTACRRTLPDVARMLTYLRDELDALARSA